MKLSYLPEVVSPTDSTIFPIVTNGVSKKVQLTTLNMFSVAGGTIGSVSAGQNVKLDPNPATTSATIAFSFPGAIFPLPNNTFETGIPTGWLLCNGQAVSRRTYSTLFNVIGISYGSGDNRTTFNLPDLRGRTIAGRETMGGVSTSGRLTNSRPGNVDGTLLGAIGGSETHTLSSQEAGLNSHNHSHTLSVSWGGDNERGNRCDGGNGSTTGRFESSTTYTIIWNYSFTSNATSIPSATSHPNLPPLVFLNWAIKY